MVKRYIVMFITLAVIIAVFIVGAYTPLSEEYASFLANTALKKFEHILRSDFPHMMLGIFLNNASICLLVFIPVAGVALGLLAIYSTGLVMSALAIVSNKSRDFLLAHVFSTPHTWIEFLAYSIALSENIILTYTIIAKFLFRKNLDLTGELKTLAKEVVIALALLILGAIVESLIIMSQRI